MYYIYVCVTDDTLCAHIIIAFKEPLLLLYTKKKNVIATMPAEPCPHTYTARTFSHPAVYVFRVRIFCRVESGCITHSKTYVIHSMYYITHAT